MYQCPSASLKENETTYTVVVGEKTAFDRSGTGKKLADFGPKSTDLILVTETRTPFCWMSPDGNVSYDDAIQGISSSRTHTSGSIAPLTKIGSNHINGCNAGLRSGAVTFLTDLTELSLWQVMLEGTMTEREFRKIQREKAEKESGAEPVPESIPQEQQPGTERSAVTGSNAQ